MLERDEARTRRHGRLPAGVGAALLAAALFGAGTPLAKALIDDVGPWMLAGLLYLGSGLGLALLRLLRRASSAGLAPGEWPWLAGAVLAGGVIGPVLLMLGLANMPASGASLPLNAEGSSRPCWPGWPSRRTSTVASRWAWAVHRSRGGGAELARRRTV